jgi:enoyl-CoA hydratase
MKSFETVLTSVHGRVGMVQFNRPEAYNAFNPQMIRETMEALEAFDADDGIGAMVVTGNDKAFAAGADIKFMAESTPIEMLNNDFVNTFDHILKVRKPIIAAVSGWCVGGGNEFMMSCDMVVASETAKFGQPEINLGVIPGAGGTQRLTKLVGKPIAMEMVLNNRTLSAEEALRFGLINRVAPVEDYLDEALKLATEIANRAPIAIRLAKEAVNKTFETTLSTGLDDERRLFNLLFGTEDQKEGMRAFIEKRQPKWQGK